MESAAAGPAVPTAMTVELKRTASAVATVRMRTLIRTPREKPGSVGRVTSRAARHPHIVM